VYDALSLFTLKIYDLYAKNLKYFITIFRYKKPILLLSFTKSEMINHGKSHVPWVEMEIKTIKCNLLFIEIKCVILINYLYTEIPSVHVVTQK